MPGAAQQAFLYDILTRLSGSDRAAVTLPEVDGEFVAAQSVLECECGFCSSEERRAARV